ncbi:sensor histidine kinase [Sphingomonas ursincola]|uniref:sensor histidine kinase n=1 Tax=Sphingomonas ursincola TaxID=56361 RepID=UPI002354D48D|nr:HAMP domain-containing sensor histidine kinase [Sphingomonas ursincola]MBY0620763.1 HAMP domain-containing histidine kinase [Sphingomonas ursincola]
MSLFQRLWPSSLAGRLLLTIAFALLAGQLVNAALLVRAQREQALDRIAAEASVRLIAATDRLQQGRPLRERFGSRIERAPGFRLRRTDLTPDNPVQPDMRPAPGLVSRLAAILPSYGVPSTRIDAALMPAPPRARRVDRLAAEIGGRNDRPISKLALIAIQRPDGQWLSVRVPVPEASVRILATIIGQTVILYLVMLVPLVWLTRRIARSMGTLREGVAHFERTQEARSIEPTGPSDLADLTRSFNAMSARIAAMLNEKDVMLGAIGHDLKTPLAALRVRVESVPDDRQRERMVASIDDITRTLDDILTLARIGRTGEEREPVNLGALVEMIADEYRDLGQDVALADTPRIVVPLQLTWIRRALRNLIGNGVRYGARARVSIAQIPGRVSITIDDDGPGIPDDQIERMFEPFTRLEASRNMATGGTGLGLTLARAILHQHGGALWLENRRGASGVVEGLRATMTLPMG